MDDPTWLTDERIREIKHGEDASRSETLALAGEVRVRRRTVSPRVRGTIILYLTVIAVVLAGARVHGERSPMFQGIAHIYVGGLFGAWIASRHNWPIGLIGVALTLLEIGCAIASRVR